MINKNNILFKYNNKILKKLIFNVLLSNESI